LKTFVVNKSKNKFGIVNNKYYLWCMKKNDEILTMKIEGQDKQELVRLASERGITLSGLIRMVMKDFIKKEVKGE